MLDLVLQLVSRSSLLYERGAKFRVLSGRFTESTLLRLAAQHRVIVSIRG